jgi:HEAT repeat protein
MPLADAVPMLLEVAKRLRRPPDLAARLAHLARHDPLPGVRLANLLTLVAECADDPATEPALVTACGDESDRIRAEATIALGERGRDTLLETVGGGGRATLLKIARGTRDDGAGVRAFAALHPPLSFAIARSVLTQARRVRLLETARACLAWLARAGNADATRLVVKVMSVEKADIAVAAVEALAAAGSPGAEPALLVALARDVPEVRTAAARALGRIGSVAAVLPLKEAEARHARDIAFKRDARQAIAEIQSRVAGGSPGQVSLAEGEGGALSLVDDERGRLSLKGSSRARRSHHRG